MPLSDEELRRKIDLFLSNHLCSASPFYGETVDLKNADREKLLALCEKFHLSSEEK